MQELKDSTGIDDSSKMNMKRNGPSKMAEGIALHRFMESARPKGERICYDPYAVRFISPEAMEAFKDPGKAKAAHEHYERLFPGLGNSIRARVRYFDDFIRSAVIEGLEQLIILGAGYDTRAYRIEGMKDKVLVFEVDLPETLQAKREKIKEIFGSLPDHVVYVPVDFHAERLGQRLMECGYNRSLKTLFVMEGLVMYLPAEAVDDILAFIIGNSGKGSAILFDYFPDSVIKGTCDAGRNMREYAEKAGEPLQFGIPKGTVESFLAKRGFSQIQNVTSEDYKKAYFHGANNVRMVSNLLSIVHATI
jgi:methyltransferase (TIGR00027 family)